MTPMAALVFSVGLTGLTLLLSCTRRLGRSPLTERLGPYAHGATTPRRRPTTLAAAAMIIVPMAHDAAGMLARAFGVRESAAVRLRRIHAAIDASAFRRRQLAWMAAAVGVVTPIATAAALPTPAAVLGVVGAPLLAFLVMEQRLSTSASDWQRRLGMELPTVAEEVGMLLAAGWSLGGALARVADRGRGCAAADLTRVVARTRQGVTEVEALREWAELAAVDAVHRFVAVFALHLDTPDLSRLISDEARVARREAQRTLIEAIERRTQQVWVPVTVAALVPGVLLMGVPFVDALRLFSSG